MTRLFERTLSAALLLALSTPAMAQDAVEEAAPLEEAAPVEEAMPVEQAAPAPEEVQPVADAPTQEAAATPAPAGAAEPPAKKCVLDELCFGPILTLGLFNPLGIGVHARYGEMWGFGFDYQFLPSISFGDSSAGISLITLDGRFYMGNFFLSAGFAYQSFDADASATSIDPMDPTQTTSVSVEGSVGIPAIKLGLGVMGHDGFVMGIDLALEVPLGSADVEFSSSGTGADDDIEALEKDIQDGADVLVDLLPFLIQLNLIRIGYIF